MGEPLKDMYHEEFLRGFSRKVQTRLPSFDGEGFLGLTLGAGRHQPELKARMRRISESLAAVLLGGYVEQVHLSTRRHYPGIHRLSLVVNGQEKASAEAVLLP